MKKNKVILFVIIGAVLLIAISFAVWPDQKDEISTKLPGVTEQKPDLDQDGMDIIEEAIRKALGRR